MIVEKYGNDSRVLCYICGCFSSYLEGDISVNIDSMKCPHCGRSEDSLKENREKFKKKESERLKSMEKDSNT